MKNWVKETWDKIKEIPIKTVAIGGGVLIGGAVITWILTTVLGKAFFRKK